MTTTHRATRKRRRLAAAGVVGLASLALAGPGTALAGSTNPILRDHYSFSDSWVWEDYCHVDGRPDLTVQYDSRFDGMFLLTSHGPDGLAYGADNFRFTNVRTNLVNGKTLTTDGVQKGRDLKVIDNGDGTLTLQLALLLSLRTYDTPGNILDREASRLVIEFLIDDNGTPTNPFDDGEPEFVGVVHDFVGFINDIDWCAVVHDVLE